jgi:lysophospholipase L1-like esterase
MLLRSTYNRSVMIEGYGSRSLLLDVATGGLLDTTKSQVFATRLASYSPATIILSIGTNDYGVGGWSASGSGAVANFSAAYSDLIDRLHAALPSATIICQSPLIRTADGTLQAWRDAIQTLCGSRAWSTFVDGKAILVTSDLSGDGLHPTTAGHAKYALSANGWIPNNTAPSVTIVSGSGTHAYGSHDAITATATDTEDGTITSSIVWTSNIQSGTLSTGSTLYTNNLIVGTHLITASSTDSGGLTGTASVNVSILFGTTSVVSFGSNNIALLQNQDYSYSILTAENTTASQSNYILSLGGMPLSISRIGNSYYAIDVIKKSGFSDEGLSLNYNGITIKVLTNSFDQNTISTAVGSGSGNIGVDVNGGLMYTVISGIPIAINSHNDIITVDRSSAGTVTEYAQFYFGGTALLDGRVGYKWYLILST